jgi:two-component system phosphate regulon sensor histidine kinase PhoR
MQRNKTGVFIAISSLALLLVLIIQVKWILQTAKIKEELFNEKANMVLNRTAQALASDTVTCKQMVTCVGQNELNKTDSLFSNYMKYYDFHPNYTFEVRSSGTPEGSNTTFVNGSIYKRQIEQEASNNGLELNLFLSDKKQFIVAEMGTMFLTSVILILVVLLFFWWTIYSLTKQKRMAEESTEFISNMTHEFKTPLTNIALAGRMIQKNSNAGQEKKMHYYASIILNENEKLSHQVDHVLGMTDMERGGVSLNLTLFDFHKLIDEVLQTMQLQLTNKDVEVKKEFNAKSYFVRGDKIKMTVVICNLIDNAIKYANTQPELQIQTYNREGLFVVSVADNGIGIMPQFHDKVFDKFYRVPTGDIHNVKGFGIGLTFVKKIIELHKGTIRLQSELGRGSTFIISLHRAD